MRPGGHLVAVEEHVCRFGHSHRPICVEDNCGFVGPFVPRGRAEDIAEEHRRKSAGIWVPAR